jgi:hypothetical protein
VDLRRPIVLTASLAVLWGILGLSTSATPRDQRADPAWGEGGPQVFAPRRLETNPPTVSRPSCQDSTLPEYAVGESDEPDDEGYRFLLFLGDPLTASGSNSVRGMRGQPGPPIRRVVGRIFLLCRGLVC